MAGPAERRAVLTGVGRELGVGVEPTSTEVGAILNPRDGAMIDLSRNTVFDVRQAAGEVDVEVLFGGLGAQICVGVRSRWPAAKGSNIPKRDLLGDCACRVGGRDNRIGAC